PAVAVGGVVRALAVDDPLARRRSVVVVVVLASGRRLAVVPAGLAIGAARLAIAAVVVAGIVARVAAIASAAVVARLVDLVAERVAGEPAHDAADEGPGGLLAVVAADRAAG